MESRGPEDSKNVKTSQAYFFEDFSLTKSLFLPVQREIALLLQYLLKSQ